MTRLILNLSLGCCLLGTAAAQPANPIQQLVLNPLVVTRIPIAFDRPTIVRFPSPISDIEGAFIATEPDPSALFLLTFHAGSPFFSLRALAHDTNATLNVVFKEQTYVLELAESNEPWLSVIFTPPPVPPPAAARHPVTPSRLMGFLDMAKAYPVLKPQHPEAVAGIECVRTNLLHEYGDYAIKTEEVFRFDNADTLVFRVVLSNKTAQLISYLPQSLMVRAGERVFYQSVTDASGEIPAHTSVPVYFAITGTTDGGRNDLSPRNEFMVLLNRLESPAAPLQAATEPATNALPVASTVAPGAAPGMSLASAQPTLSTNAPTTPTNVSTVPTQTVSQPKAVWIPPAQPPPNWYYAAPQPMYQIAPGPVRVVRRGARYPTGYYPYSGRTSDLNQPSAPSAWRVGLPGFSVNLSTTHAR